jgi:hypothetical protein
MSRNVKIQIELKSPDDLNKLSLKISPIYVAYQPEARVIKAILGISLSFPKTVYRYGYAQLEGEPSTSETFEYSLKDPKDLEMVKTDLASEAYKEFNQIKSEVLALLKYTNNVTVDLNEILNRIVQKKRPTG